jgi:hypothetical protein
VYLNRFFINFRLEPIKINVVLAIFVHIVLQSGSTRRKMVQKMSFWNPVKCPLMTGFTGKYDTNQNIFLHLITSAVPNSSAVSKLKCVFVMEVKGPYCDKSWQIIILGKLMFVQNLSSENHYCDFKHTWLMFFTKVWNCSRYVKISSDCRQMQTMYSWCKQQQSYQFEGIATILFS